MASRRFQRMIHRPPEAEALGWVYWDCPCGKRAYVSVSVARQAHAHCGWRVRTYQCDRDRAAFHVTHETKERHATGGRPRQSS